MGRGLGEEQRSILLHIATRTDHPSDGIPWRNNHTGSDNPASSRASTSRALRSLERRGLIERTHHRYHEGLDCSDEYNSTQTTPYKEEPDMRFRLSTFVTPTEAGVQMMYKLILESWGDEYRNHLSDLWIEYLDEYKAEIKKELG